MFYWNDRHRAEMCLLYRERRCETLMPQRKFMNSQGSVCSGRRVARRAARRKGAARLLVRWLSCRRRRVDHRAGTAVISPVAVPGIPSQSLQSQRLRLSISTVKVTFLYSDQEVNLFDSSNLYTERSNLSFARF